LSDDQSDGGPSPEAQIEETEQQARLRRLVRSLDQSEQELIALKFGAGMTNRDIAPVLGKTETAVGSAVYRVMQKLRAQWQDTHE
jgi:RNA polymerase sigma-70 factor (ECF subfamily)